MKKPVSFLAALCLCAALLSLCASADDSVKPDWYPDDPQNFVFFHDTNAPRVVDDADLFTAAEEQRMAERIESVRATLNKDVVIYTSNSLYGLDRRTLAADFYDFNGYGCGEEREGICLLICMDPSNRGWEVCCTGSETRALYTQERASVMDEALYNHLAAGEYAEGVENWLDQAAYLLKTGRLPRSAASWGITAAISALIGTLFGGVALGRAKAKMRTPRVKTNADSYIARGGVRIVPLRDDHVGTTSTRRYSPREERSGGGSGGHSSYSGSFSGSSGASHSGSGGNF